MHGTITRSIGFVAAALVAATGCEGGGGACSNGLRDGLETDMDCAGGCDPCAEGRGCFADSDCVSGICDREVCVAVEPACDDVRWNGDETDTDCGGATCEMRCLDGASCHGDEDCVSGRCDGGLCSSCSDHLRNGDETGVDCGGSCPLCPDGTPCEDGEECESLVCEDGECHPAACDDLEQNGGESDVDCGAVCPAPCPVESACFESDDCEPSAFCDDSICVRAASCLELLTRRPATTTGAYEIDPGATGEPGSCTVLCDMTTDGGGWTLVASSLGEPIEDAASACHGDLATAEPAAARASVWSGLRDLVAGSAHESDLRFSCKGDVADFSFEVDLVFYGVPWYYEVTRGTDTHSCFAPELDGAGEAILSPPPPPRVDLLSGTARDATDPWVDGVFHGERACVDPDSFAVDLDGPGLSAPGALGLTSWGEVDGEPRCGPAALEPGQGAWFVWLRETPAGP